MGKSKKTGRNDPCPCGSGLKYKKCCLQKKEKKPAARGQEQARRVFVKKEIEKLCRQAADMRNGFRLIGALAFFSTPAGDAWLAELADMDAVQVARNGRALDVTVNETEDLLEIGWTHRFEVKGNLFVTTSYKDGSVTSHMGCPAKELTDAVDGLRRQYSKQELADIYLKG